MRTEQELLTAMRDMAKDAGEVFAHLRAAEDGLKRALARIPDGEVEEIDPATEIGMKVDGIRLVLRRAVLPVASACGSLATDFGIAVEIRGQRSEVGGQRAEIGGQRSEVGGQNVEPPTCQVCVAPMIRFLRGPV
jgi:hypothetical protein